MSDIKCQIIRNSENLKKLPTWVEQVINIKNNFSREFVDQKDEAKWEKKKADLICKYLETSELFDDWRRDTELTNRIEKRQKRCLAKSKESLKEMVECGSRLGIEVTPASARLVAKGPRVS
jgi:hypothetical protein